MNRNRFLSSAGWLATLGLLLVIPGGCGPRLTSAEFGTIVHEIPKLPGSDKPYPMPQLDEPESTTDELPAAEEPAAASADTAQPAPAQPPGPAQEPEPKRDEDPPDTTPESQE